MNINLDREVIDENWTLKKIDDFLKVQMDKCEIVCDLNLIGSERNVIKKALQNRLALCPDNTSCIKTLNYYPTLTLTDFVYFARHDFDHESIWEKWGETLGLHLNPNHQSELGKKFLEILELNDFPVDADGGMKYISPILVQTGIPDISLVKLFNVLDGAKSDLYFDPRSFINEIIGFREYLVDRSVIRYFKFYQERAEETILQLYEMFNMLGNNPSQSDLQYVQSSGIDLRFAEEYIKWRSDEKQNKRKNSKTETYYQRPRLIYDVVKGISILLPKQVMRNQYINTVEWRIQTLETRDIISVHAAVFQDDENYSESKIVPVIPSEGYEISIYDADDNSKPLTMLWRLDLPYLGELVCFSAKGELSRNPSITYDGLVVVYKPEKVQIREKNKLQEFEGIPLHSTWSKYRAFKVFPIDKQARLVLDNRADSIVIESSKDLDAELSDRYTILNTRKKFNPIPLYSRFPVVEINCFEVMEDLKALSNIKIQVYHPLTNKKITCELNNNICDVVESIVYVDLNKICCGMDDEFGKYEIKISFKENRKVLFFFLGPNVIFSETVIKLEDYFNQPDEVIKSFSYKPSEKYKLKFNSEIIEKEDYKSGTNWHVINMCNQSAFLEGEVLIPISNRFISMPFIKEIRPLEWSLYDMNSITEENINTKFGLTTLFPKKKGINWRLVLRFTEKPADQSQLLISLQTSNRESLQQVKVSLDPSGQFSIDLMVFSDTVLNTRLPLYLRLILTDARGYNTSINLLILEDFLEFENMKYVSYRDKMCLVWQSKEDFGNRILKLTSLGTSEPVIKEYNLSEYEILQINSKGEKFKGIFPNDSIEKGIYAIEIKLINEMKNIFGKKKDTYTRIDQSKLLTVKVKALVEDYRRLDKPCLQQALTLLMCGLKSVIFADEISKALKERKLTFDESLSSCYRALLDIVRAMSSEVDLSDEAKAKIKPVINDIIIQNMKPTDRSKLIDFLLKAKLSVSESLQIINELQLYCLTGGEYTHELIKSASDIQNEMALLMILNNSLENSPMDIQRLISTTGADLLIERIIFQNSNEEIECEFAEKFSLVLSEHTNKCLSTSLLDKDIMGSGQVFSDFMTRHYMEITKGKRLSLIKDDELDKEVEFLGSTYSKILLHWFDGRVKSGKTFDISEVQEAEHDLEKYRSSKQACFKVAEERINGVSDSLEHRSFRLSALISLLMTTDLCIELQSIASVMRFWRSFVIIFPKLAYRDMILAKLSQKLI